MALFGKKKTPQEIAQEANKQFRASVAQYVTKKITLEQLTQQFYDVNRTIPPTYWLDPDFQVIILDKSGMNINEIAAFSIGNLQATQRMARER